MKALIIFFILFSTSCFAKDVAFENNKIKLNALLTDYKLLEARSLVEEMQQNKLKANEWVELRDIIHQFPQIGLDLLLSFDKRSPLPLNKIDLIIKRLDQLMMAKDFKKAASGYQIVLKVMTKNKNFKNGRNYHLYWSIVHSLGRTLYALKQYDEAYKVYTTIPSSYPFYKQVQFELMWNTYMNGRLEYSLGAIATMASGHFSKILEPEVYLLQYYIYRRMCRDEEVDIIKKRVKLYQNILNKYKFPLVNWLKKDVETLVYKQILQSGDMNGKEGVRLKKLLDQRMNAEVKRWRKEFDLVAAHLDVDSGKNKNLEPVKTLLSVDQLLSTSNEKWNVEDNEIWSDELGKQVFIQKDLCKKE